MNQINIINHSSYYDVDTFSTLANKTKDCFTVLKEYSSLQENPYNVRYIHTVLIVHIYFAPWGVDNV